ncbi:MAG: hypothetical protein KKA07_11760, partial [Bacteroidetes bacterium]|nr:hypothetical protein [Bacteroidota bacterium]
MKPANHSAAPNCFLISCITVVCALLLSSLSSAQTLVLHNQTTTGNAVTFNNALISESPVFAASVDGIADYNAVLFEVNNMNDFSGTAYTQTFTGVYSASTVYAFMCNNLQPTFPVTGNAVFYVRFKVSDNGGSTWTGWSTQLWSFTQNNSIYGWAQSQSAQFSQGTLQGIADTAGIFMLVTDSGIVMTPGNFSTAITTGADDGV